jgi:AraC-like DNA-binding protein
MSYDPMTMDEVYARARRRKRGPLSEVLQALRMTGAVFFDTKAGAPWVSETPNSAEFGCILFPDAEHVVPFHVVLEGSCWVEIPGAGEPAFLGEGGVVIVPRGDHHVMGSVPGMRESGPPSLSDYRKAVRLDRPLFTALNHASDHAASCRFICGFIGCDTQPFNPLIDALPRLLVARIPSANRSLLESLLNLAVDETGAASAEGDSALAKMAEMLFVEVLREYMMTLPADSQGWFSGVRDRHVGAALRLIHNRPATPWSIEKLAREVGLSRSAFAERFTHFVGIAPMSYLARWRMQMAAALLRRDEVTISRAAIEVGYESEAAFHRAFKRYAGVSPGNWRRARVAQASRTAPA